jgi:uncharacterized protein (DUF2267 family)
MDYDQFIEAVAQRAQVPRDEAEALARATLMTLSERINGGQARDLAEQLPDRMRGWLLPTDENAERFDPREFLRRVGVHAEVDTDRAEQGTRAALATLRDAVTRKEFSDMFCQLPKDYWIVVEPRG